MAYCDLTFFEDYIMKEDPKNNYFYILSSNFNKISNKGILLSHLSNKYLNNKYNGYLNKKEKIDKNCLLSLEKNLELINFLTNNRKLK